jgi:RNA polymerase sigma-70 factor (ECF subfamily)
LLFYLKGYSIREIADIVNATEDAVKKQLSRGRDKLKTLLKNE